MLTACLYFTGWLKLWLRQQMSKRGADGYFERWPGSVKVSGKKFFTIKNSIERKKFKPMMMMCC